MSKEKNKETNETVINEVKEVASEIINEVKEDAENIVEAGKEVVTKVSESVNTVPTTKKATWWNRIWSAIVGAVLAVGAMFGITSEQVAGQKAKTEEVKKFAAEALEYAKQGKCDDAKAALEIVVETSKDVINDTKEVVDKVKDAKAEDIAAEAVKGAKEALK
jgi:methyl-accepting chemotaxis protein